MRLASLDLNLLVALDALIQAESVTAAAQRMNCSQPAMSGALSRLRDALDDPILVRAGQRMVCTPRAKALAEPVREILNEIERTLRPTSAFDPSSSTQSFAVASAGLAASITSIIPEFLRLLVTEAPRAQVEFRMSSAALCHDDLENGRLDLAFLPTDRLPDHLYHQVLINDAFACVSRQGPSELPDELDLEAFLAARHVRISSGGQSLDRVDDALTACGRTRDVFLTVPDFALAPVAILSADCIAVLPDRYARALSGNLPLRVQPVPIDLPAIRIAQVWHERTHRDPACLWLRALLARAAGIVPT